jgi:xanthine dehydrogenase molybdopterin-binding subunit B
MTMQFVIRGFRFSERVKHIWSKNWHVSLRFHLLFPSGEAVYCDDIPPYQGELYLALVPSTRAHAKVLNIDASKALALPGVVLFLSARDLEPSCNIHGTIEHDEEVFVTTEVSN